MKELTSQDFAYEKGALEGKVQIDRKDGVISFVEFSVYDQKGPDYAVGNSGERDSLINLQGKIRSVESFREFITELLNLIEP